MRIAVEEGFAVSGISDRCGRDLLLHAAKVTYQLPDLPFGHADSRCCGAVRRHPGSRHTLIDGPEQIRIRVPVFLLRTG